MRVLIQAIRVAAVGIALGLGTGLLLGFPELAPEETLCLPPGSETAEGEATTSPTWVSQETARSMHSNPAVAFVDARARDDFHAGHVAGALSVPMDDGTVPPDVVGLLRGADTVIAYCDTTDGCSHSSRLAGLLVSAGIHDVRVLQDGIGAWLESGYPGEAGVCRLCP